MATLPSIDVTTPQLGVITDVWGKMDPTRTPTQNYQRWLRQQIIAEVLRVKRAEIDALYAAEVQKLSDKRTEVVDTWVRALEDPADPYKPPVAPSAAKPAV